MATTDSRTTRYLVRNDTTLPALGGVLRWNLRRRKVAVLNIIFESNLDNL